MNTLDKALKMCDAKDLNSTFNEGIARMRKASTEEELNRQFTNLIDSMNDVVNYYNRQLTEYRNKAFEENSKLRKEMFAKNKNK